MKKGKKLLALSLAVVLLSSLAACGNTENTNSTGGSDIETGKIEIIYQTWKGDSRPLEAYEGIKELENVDVKVLNLALEDSFSKMKIDLASNSGSDVYAVYGEYMFEATNEYMLPLDEYIAGDLGEDWRSKFPEQFIKECSDADGVIKGLGSGYINEGIWMYNADIFEKYGVKPPETYDDLVEICRIMREDGFVPAMVGGSEGWLLAQLALSIATQTAPGEIYDAILLKSSWNTEGMIKTFEVFQDMFDTVWQDGAVTATHYGDSIEALKSEKTAMFVGGIASIDHFMRDATGNLNIKTFVFPDCNGDGKKSSVCAGVDEKLMVNKFSKHPDEAFEVVAAWAYGDAHDYMLKNKGGTFPYFNNEEPDQSSWTPAAKGLFDSFMSDFDKIEYSTNLGREDTTILFHETLMQLAAKTITPEEAVKQLDENSKNLS